MCRRVEEANRKMKRKNIVFFFSLSLMFIRFGLFFYVDIFVDVFPTHTYFCRVSSDTIAITICDRSVADATAAAAASASAERVRLCKTRICVSIEGIVLCIVTADTGTC